MVNPGGLAIATVTCVPLATDISEIARRRLVPIPVKAPFVAPITVMSADVKLDGLILKVSVKAVVVTVPDVPFAVNVKNTTAVAATFTATYLLAGVIVNPTGFAIATVTFAPLATVMSEIARLRRVPVPVNAPLVAPVTVMSAAVKLVGLISKVSVNAVVVTVPDVPFAVKPEKATGQTGDLHLINTSPSIITRTPKIIRFIFFLLMKLYSIFFYHTNE